MFTTLELLDLEMFLFVTVIITIVTEKAQRDEYVAAPPAIESVHSWHKGCPLIFLPKKLMFGAIVISKTFW